MTVRGIPLDQLPADVRARLNLPARRRKNRAVVSQREAKSRWECRGVAAGGCGVVVDSYAAMERHMSATGHSRYDLVFKEELVGKGVRR